MGISHRNGHKHQKMIISSPAPPVTTQMIVFLRTFNVMFLLLSAVMLHICLLFRPWKQEWIGKPSTFLELSVWHVCKAKKKNAKCYKGEYDNAPGWFLAFRWFLMTAAIIQYLCVIFTIIKIFITNNAGRRHFWLPAMMSVVSAVLILASMLILVGYREFEFLEETRMYKMGWRFESRHESRWGWPYYMSWCTFAVCLISFLVCMITESADIKHSKFYETAGLRKQAQQMMR